MAVAEASSGVGEMVVAITLRPSQRLVLDVASIKFCDSSGITALIATRNHAHATQADIALIAVPAHTMRILHIVGLDQIFTIEPDSQTATRKDINRLR